MRGGWKVGTFQPPLENRKIRETPRKAKNLKYLTPHKGIGADLLSRWLERSNLPTTSEGLGGT